jgi:hypothetical protein
MDLEADSWIVDALLTLMQQGALPHAHRTATRLIVRWWNRTEPCRSAALGRAETHDGVCGDEDDF